MLYSLSLFNEWQEGFFVGLFATCEKARQTAEHFLSAARNFCSAKLGRYDQSVFLPFAEYPLSQGGLCRELSQEELEQLRYWNPQTVGEIIFNTWD